MKCGCALKKNNKKIKVAIFIVRFISYSVIKMLLNSVLVSVKVTCCIYMLEILSWPWLVLRKGWFNSIKDALVVVLGWPAGLNTSFIYGRLVLLQNLNDIELIICLKQSFTGSQLIFWNSFCPICALLFKFRQNRMRLFWIICNFDFNLLFNLGYQSEQA